MTDEVVKFYVLDNNVIIDKPEYLLKERPTILLDSILKEIDSLEHTTKDKDLQYDIRQAKKVISLIANNQDDFPNISYNEPHGFHDDVDSDLIDFCYFNTSSDFEEVTGISDDNPKRYILVTGDTMLASRAKFRGVEVEFVEKEDKVKDVKEFEPIVTLTSPEDDDLIAEIYQEGKNFRDDIFREGQYIEIISNDGCHSDEMKYSDGKIVKLDLTPIGNRYYSDTVKAINARQKFAIDMLNDDDKLVSLLKGAAGSGKTLIAMSKALQDLNDKQRKIVFIKNDIPVKGAPKIGFLPGDENSKLYHLADSLIHVLGSRINLDNLIDEESLEIVNLSSIRGVQYSDATIIIDEGQNITWSLYKTILTRIGKNSRVIITLDDKQIDLPYNDTSGVEALQQFSDSSIFNAVILDRVERSKIAELAENVL